MDRTSIPVSSVLSAADLRRSTEPLTEAEASVVAVLDRALRVVSRLATVRHATAVDLGVVVELLEREDQRLAKRKHGTAAGTAHA
jgi:hypothetical protein